MSKIMFASDIHGDFGCARRLIERYSESGAERLVILGDLLYHGPRNDLPDGYAPKRVIELLNSVKGELLCVRGNCDTEVDAMVLEFPIMADYAYISVDGLRMLATHGHKFNLDALPPLSRGDVLLNGHTHVSAAMPFGEENLYVNPGSVSIPKGGTPRGYVLYENGRFDFYTLDGEKYNSYSI